MSHPKTPPVLTDTRLAVNSFLKNFFDTMCNEAEKIDQNYAALWAELARLSLAGGKRLRPHLFFLSYNGFGGTKPAERMPVAAAIELLHISLLVHDDIIDRDNRRYGQPNIAGSYAKHYQSIVKIAESEAEHFAASAALLAGDIGLSESYQLLLSSHASATHKQALTDLFGQTIRSVMAGELMDTEAGFMNPENNYYLKIAELKTASYSCVLPLVAGALLANAPKNDITAMEKLGVKLGIAYQLTDDLLGMFGNPAQTGKSALSDLREGKRTLLIQITLEQATPTQKKTLVGLLGKKTASQKELLVAQGIIENSGAKTLYEQRLEAEAKEVIKICQESSLSSEVKAELQKLVQQMLFRNH